MLTITYLLVFGICSGYLQQEVAMINYVDEEVGVITVYNAQTHTIKPAVMQWNGKRYTIERVAFYHPVRKGRVLHHVYSVTDGAIDFFLSILR